MEYFAGALVVGAVLAFVALPLVRRQDADDSRVAQTTSSADERAAIYRELVELELDHRIGKLTVTDFREHSDALLARAAALIVAEEAQTGDADEQVEREIAAMRQALRLSPSASAAERQP